MTDAHPHQSNPRLRFPWTAFALALSLTWLAAPMARAGDADQPPQGDIYQVGVAEVDVTPDYPIRLNGFGFRREESEGVSQRIWAKAIAIGADDEQPAVLITLDSLGIRMTMVDEVARRLKRSHNIRRDRIALTFSHSHCTPKVNGACDNIFSQPIPEAHQAHIDRYTRELTDKLEAVAIQALENRAPSRLSWSVGEVTFAKNRRTPGGPVDHDLPLLAVRDLEGRLRAVYVSYACHCVTLSHNKISGDWAGYAQELIERKFPGAIGMVSIGAGSDSNPLSGVTGDKVDVAAAQGAQIADEAARLLERPLRPLQGELDTRLETIDLPLNDPPSREELKQIAARGGPAGYNATTQLARLERGESLAQAIPYPVQTWTFGDSLAMVFLAGEVCVDYSLRLKKELDRERLWINAYSNDFCSYIPSERLVREGGYGGGSEIPYFALPNTLKSGLERRIIDQVKQQLPAFQAGQGTQGVPPKSPEDSRQSIRVHERLRVELAASEPLVDDPVAIDFGADGRLWVAEMPDYTQPTDAEFRQQGRIKWLRDTDGDGRFDRGTVFLDGLRFPTDVKVWREGVLVCDAPDILWAADTDDDGKADVVKKLLTGFATHNPHARVNSLRLGLDHWLYGSGGLFGGEIRQLSGQAAGRTVDVSGRDFRFHPDSGTIEPVTGRTQQGRVRDDWGNWFGCDNGTILRHYPLADHYLRRNPHAAPPATSVFVPRYAPPGQLFPTGGLVRFKLSGPAGRPTSVCGLGIYRAELLGADFAGNGFVCEPVNQLVHRLILEEEGTLVRGRRAPEEQDREFLTSTDRWFRPVQVRTGPDGALWVVDMYRYVIEHPRWIPPETLSELDTFAGRGRGRLYRIVPRDHVSSGWPRLDQFTAAELAERMDDANGTLRDMVQQLLIWRGDDVAVPVLQRVARDGKHPAGRLQALVTLDALDALDDDLLVGALNDEHAGVRRHAIRLAEPKLDGDDQPRQAVYQRADDPSAMVWLQLAYSLGAVRDEGAAPILARLLLQQNDIYVRAAAVSSLNQHNISAVIQHVVRNPPDPANLELLDQLLASASGLSAGDAAGDLVRWILPEEAEVPQAWQLRGLARALERDASQRLPESVKDRIAAVMRQARRLATDDQASAELRLEAIRLLGEATADDRAALLALLSPREPLEIQQVAVRSLAANFHEETTRGLLNAWTSSSPTIRDTILDALLQRRETARMLLQAIGQGTISAAGLDASRQARLMERLDADDRRRAADALRSQAGGDREAVLANYQETLRLKGDAAAGRAVFNKVCADCHRLNGQGHVVGPDLAALTNRGSEALLKATLIPSSDVDARYLNYVLVDSAGKVFSGILVEESATSVTLSEPAGKRHTILRRDIEQLQASGKSFMPDGLEKDLSPQDLANLFAYIQSASAPAPAR